MTSLMTPEEVAEYLAIPVSTLYQWRTKGHGPVAVRLGRHLRWRRTEVDLWLDNRSGHLR